MDIGSIHRRLRCMAEEFLWGTKFVFAQSVSDLRTSNRGRKAKIRAYCHERGAIIPTCGRAGCEGNIRTSAFPLAPGSPPRCVVQDILRTIPEHISPAERLQNDTEREESSGAAESGQLHGRALR